MRDPFFVPPPEWLVKATTPLAEALSLPTLPYHVHEIIIAFSMYQLIHSYISPYLSARFFPETYNNFNKRTRINWDVHVVSLVQSLLVNTTGLYLMFFDEERRQMNWAGRIWGYDGASGMLQGLAGGYFIWDLIITIRHVDIFGVGMLLHAISAVTVFSLGFRPFLNYYGPVFILYELSSPALNIHWFLDKLHLTGSIYQLINGVVLITTFFSCRLIWGSIQSVYVFSDIWHAMHAGKVIGPASDLLNNTGILEHLPQPLFTGEDLDVAGGTGVEDIMAFAGTRSLPEWLALCYLASNIVLNVLNYYWFGKMIETLRKRFEPPLGTKRVEKKEDKKEAVPISTESSDNHKTIDLQGRESVRSRRRG